MSTTRFPRIVTETLAGRSLVLPDSLEDRLAVVLIAFRRHAQPIVDSWMAPIGRLISGRTDIEMYEVPVLSGGWRMVSGFIDGGMRAGIPVHKHESVATFYGDTTRFRHALSINDLNSAYAFLVNSRGEIIWNASGWASKADIAHLENLVSTPTA